MLQSRPLLRRGTANSYEQLTLWHHQFLPGSDQDVKTSFRSHYKIYKKVVEASPQLPAEPAVRGALIAFRMLELQSSYPIRETLKNQVLPKLSSKESQLLFEGLLVGCDPSRIESWSDHTFEPVLQLAQRLDNESPQKGKSRSAQVVELVATSLHKAAISGHAVKSKVFDRMMTKLTDVNANAPKDILKTWEQLEKNSAFPLSARNAVVAIKHRLICSMREPDLFLPMLDSMSDDQRQHFREMAQWSRTENGSFDRKKGATDEETLSWDSLLLQGASDYDKNRFLNLFTVYERAVEELAGFNGSPSARAWLLKLHILGTESDYEELPLNKHFGSESFKKFSSQEQIGIFPYLLTDSLFQRSGYLNTTYMGVLAPLAQTLDGKFPIKSSDTRETSVCKSIARALYKQVAISKRGPVYQIDELLELLRDMPDTQAATVWEEWKKLDEVGENRGSHGIESENALFFMKYEFASQLDRDDWVAEVFRALSEPRRNEFREKLARASIEIRDAQAETDKKKFDSIMRSVLPEVGETTQVRFAQHFLAYEKMESVSVAAEPQEAFLKIAFFQIANSGSPDPAFVKKNLAKLTPEEQVNVLRNLLSQSSAFARNRVSEFRWQCLFSQALDEATPKIQSPAQSLKKISLSQEQLEKIFQALPRQDESTKAILAAGFAGLNEAGLREFADITLHHLAAAPKDFYDVAYTEVAFEHHMKEVFLKFVESIACFSSGMISDEELGRLAKARNCSPAELLRQAQVHTLQQYRKRLPDRYRPTPDASGNNPIALVGIDSHLGNLFFFRQMAEFLYGSYDTGAVQELLRTLKSLFSNGQVQLKSSSVVASSAEEIEKCLEFISEELPSLMEKHHSKIKKFEAKTSEAPFKTLNAAGVARYLKDPERFERHSDRASALAKAVDVSWSPLSDYHYRLSINRIVQPEFERLYLRACQLNDGKSVTAESMRNVRKSAVETCAAALKAYLANSTGDVLDSTKVNEIKRVMAEAMAEAFTHHQLVTTASDLLSLEGQDLLENKISVHDLPILGRIGLAERMLRLLQRTQAELPIDQQLAAKDFDLLRAALRMSGGAFSTESWQLLDLASQNENLVRAMNVKKAIQQPNESLPLLQKLKEIAAGLLQGINYGGRSEVKFSESSVPLPVHRVTSKDQQAVYQLGVPGRRGSVEIISAIDNVQLQRKETFFRLLETFPPELLGLAHRFELQSMPWEGDSNDLGCRLGDCEKESQVIRLFPKAFESNRKLAHTTYHEIGHIVFDRLSRIKTLDGEREAYEWGTAAVPKSAWLKRWFAAIEKDGIMDSNYGSTNPSEAFCERFALYYSSLADSERHALLRRVYPNTFAMMDGARTELKAYFKSQVETPNLHKDFH